MSRNVNPYASPQTADVLSPPLADEYGAMRSGELMLITHDAVLPDRCVKCNEPAGGRMMRFRLTWYPPLAYLGLLLGLLPFVLIAVITQKKMTVRVGVCDVHVSKRRRAILVGWLLAILGIGLIISSGFGPSGAVIFFVLGGFVVILVALVYGSSAARIVWPKRIDKQCAWLKGVCPEFLATLPDGSSFL